MPVRGPVSHSFGQTKYMVADMLYITCQIYTPATGQQGNARNAVKYLNVQVTCVPWLQKLMQHPPHVNMPRWGMRRRVSIQPCSPTFRGALVDCKEVCGSVGVRHLAEMSCGVRHAPLRPPTAAPPHRRQVIGGLACCQRERPGCHVRCFVFALRRGACPPSRRDATFDGFMCASACLGGRRLQHEVAKHRRADSAGCVLQGALRGTHS